MTRHDQPCRGNRSRNQSRIFWKYDVSVYRIVHFFGITAFCFFLVLLIFQGYLKLKDRITILEFGYREARLSNIPFMITEYYFHKCISFYKRYIDIYHIPLHMDLTRETARQKNRIIIPQPLEQFYPEKHVPEENRLFLEQTETQIPQQASVSVPKHFHGYRRCQNR